jgi:hypothetical protein
VINAAQIKKIYTLLGINKLRDQKESIVSGFTGGKTTSVSAMTFQQATALISHLVSLDPEESSSTKMRNNIISKAYDMHWTKLNGQGERVIDMDHLNNWCISHGYLKKKLDEYTHKELPTLVSQFKAVYKSYLNSIK